MFISVFFLLLYNHLQTVYSKFCNQSKLTQFNDSNVCKEAFCFGVNVK